MSSLIKITSRVALAFSMFAGSVYGAKIQPVDKADASLKKARSVILAAVKSRNVNQLDPYLSANLECGLGGCSSRKEAIESLGLNDPKSGVWQDLELALNSGGDYFEGKGIFMAPYWFTEWPAEYDAFEHLFAAKKVALRSTERGPINHVIERDIVKVLSYPSDVEAPGALVKIKDTTSGKTGFVPYAALVSPIGIRVQLQNTNGTWQIANVIYGD